MNTTGSKSAFVSGLPMRPGEADGHGDDLGMKRLRQILDHAREQSVTLAPLVVPRFDGVDRFVPDQADIDAKAAADATVALVDGILNNVTLRLRVTAMLAKVRA